MKNRCQKITSLFLILVLFIACIPQASLAYTSENQSNNYKVRVSCTTKYSSHSISDIGNKKSYPSGYGMVYYSYFGSNRLDKRVNGTSNQSYWSATYFAKQGEILVKATTTGYGITVTASADR